jgi:hypothetical protein
MGLAGKEDGPRDIVVRLRKLAGMAFRELMECFYHLIVWMAAR